MGPIQQSNEVTNFLVSVLRKQKYLFFSEFYLKPHKLISLSFLESTGSLNSAGFKLVLSHFRSAEISYGYIGRCEKVLQKLFFGSETV